MKRIASIIFFLSLCTAALAYGVTEKDARSAALKYFGLKGDSDCLSLVISGSNQGTRAATQSPEFYVFNKQNGGFVIISGENSLRPVLGHSDNGTFPEYSQLPDNIKWWMDCLAASVSGMRKENIVPDEKTLRQWDNIGVAQTRGEYATVCLNTVQWTQRSPFNNQMPYLGGNQCISGCVPTAIAEIMCYYGWPTKATDSVDTYSVNYQNYGTVQYGGYDLGTVYDWKAIQSAVDTDAANELSDTEKANMSQLIKDIGMSVKAAWGTGSTSAVTSYIYKYICGPFDYNPYTQETHRRFYSDTQWSNLLKAEINAGHPILYDGCELGSDGNTSGHCFVIDGYDSDNNFHINFGWGAWANGYFWIGESYYGDQTAYIDFVPTSRATYTSFEGRLFLTNTFKNNYFSFEPSTTTITKGEKFDMYVHLHCAQGPYEGKSVLVHEDKNGNILEEICSRRSYKVVAGYYSFPYSNCKITKNIGFGDRIAVYTDYGLGTELERVTTCQNGEGVEYYPLTPYPFIDANDSYSVGERFYLKLKNNDFPYLWDRNGTSYHTEWTFYCDGVLQDEIKDYASRFYEIPKAGTWMVQATVKDMSSGEVKTVLCAQFTAN